MCQADSTSWFPPSRFIGDVPCGRMHGKRIHACNTTASSVAVNVDDAGGLVCQSRRLGLWRHNSKVKCRTWRADRIEEKSRVLVYWSGKVQQYDSGCSNGFGVLRTSSYFYRLWRFFCFTSFFCGLWGSFVALQRSFCNLWRFFISWPFFLVTMVICIVIVIS